MIHCGKYKPLAPEELEKMVLSYDEPQSHLALMDNWRKMGFSHYLEWLFSKWLPSLETRKKSKRILEQLERIGFGGMQVSD